MYTLQKMNYKGHTIEAKASTSACGVPLIRYAVDGVDQSVDDWDLTRETAIEQAKKHVDRLVKAEQKAIKDAAAKTVDLRQTDIVSELSKSKQLV